MYKKAVVTTMGIFILLVGIISFMLLADANPTFAASLEVIGDDLGLSITPDSPIFKIQNMAPGDTESSVVTVNNAGDSTFSIFLGSEKEDEDLYRNLEITIENNDGSQSYYSGSLIGLSNVALGSVVPGGAEKLNLSMHFPNYIGNEAQGKALSAKFIFTAQINTVSDSGTIDNNNNNSPNITIISNKNVPIAPAVLPDSKPGQDKAQITEIQVQSEDSKLEVMLDELIPIGALPGTGGIPALIISIAGIVIVLAGIKLKK